MKRYLVVVLTSLISAVALTVHAQTPTTELKPDLTLKARIAQLEAQVQQLSTENAVCSARIAYASQSQTQQVQQQQREALEKEAGCPIDWNVNPPVCKQVKK